MFKKLMMMCSVLAVTLLVSCGGQPDSAVKDFIKGISNKDEAAVQAVCTEQFLRDLDDLGELAEMYGKMKVGKTVVNGDSAMVEIKMGDMSDELKLVKVSGQWKINGLNR